MIVDDEEFSRRKDQELWRLQNDFMARFRREEAFRGWVYGHYPRLTAEQAARAWAEANLNEADLIGWDDHPFKER